MYIRLMRRDDVSQVTEIDKQAFPAEWPPTNFTRELENRLAYYIVACDEFQVEVPPPSAPAPKNNQSGLLAWLKNLFNQPDEKPVTKETRILGYAGMWVLADEAHIMSIASREEMRHKGVGEALLIALYELAQRHRTRVLTLEVRVSNTVAQNLYMKFGFQETGNRKGYYLDNREDALIMTTDYIGSSASQERLRRLKEEHGRKWGQTRFEIEKQNVKLG